MVFQLDFEDVSLICPPSEYMHKHVFTACVSQKSRFCKSPKIIQMLNCFPMIVHRFPIDFSILFIHLSMSFHYLVLHPCRRNLPIFKRLGLGWGKCIVSVRTLSATHSFSIKLTDWHGVDLLCNLDK